MAARTMAWCGLLVGGAMACGGCGSTEPEYDPTLPAAWATTVANRYFPLRAGATWEYGGGGERVVIEVLAGTRTVNGVQATRVRDRVYVGTALTEDTEDWYAQDDAGNVWYLGETTAEYENGRVVSTEGSWEWGVEGALPGIIMWADPGAHVGQAYRQEFLKDEAEDWGKVIAVGRTATVTAGTFADCVVTEDWNDLDGRGASLETKTYCAGVGQVLEHPADAPSDRLELVARR
jgi:hypothetical protein